MNPSSMLRNVFLMGVVMTTVVLTGCGGSEAPPAGDGPPTGAMRDTASAGAGSAAQGKVGRVAANAVQQQSGVGEPPSPVITWNELGLDAVRLGSLSDAEAARLYAMLNAALYDAMNGIAAQAGAARTPALVAVTGAPPGADARAAASAAAHAVLTALRPASAAAYQAELDADLALIADGAAKSAGVTWGAGVGHQVVALRQNDGSSPNQTQSAGAGPGQFRAGWSGAQFRNMLPFAIASAAPYISPGPPPMNSVAYSVAYTDVSTVGNAAVIDLGFERTFQFWASGGGTVQPPGEWIKLAMSLTSSQSLGLADSARLFALLGLALADAVPPTVAAKFLYRAWRPATAIQEGGSDSNLLTIANASWAPRGGSIGSSPEHVSGHSAFAGAAATILRGFFCSDLIGFSLVTDSAPDGAPRSYLNFSAAETEVGRSRVLGGIHFEFSNQAGLQTGRGVGAEVLAHALLRTQGATHSGSCPL